MKALLARTLVFAFPCVAIAQIAVLQIKVIEGEGAVHPAGARISHPLTVEITDDTGHPVPGAAVSFQLPPDGPGGLFSNGLRTDLVITDTAGRASIHAIQLSRTAGQYQIRITAAKDQLRAGVVSTQYIGEGKAAPPQPQKQQPPQPQPSQPQPQTQQPGQPPPGKVPYVERSPGITPTTAKMGSGSHKKWVIIAALAAGGGAALAVVSHSGSHSSTVSSSVVSIGSPTITVGHP
jgi:hypothetical protein